MHRPEADDDFRQVAQEQRMMARSVNRVQRLSPTIALACACYFGPAQAEKWTLDPSIDTRATWSDNMEFTPSGRSDTLLEATPSIILLGEGRRFRIAGHAAVTGQVYTEGTLDNRLLPEASLTANLEAIEHFFFIDAGITARQTLGNVFGPRPLGGAGVNTETTTDYRLSPHFEGQITPDVKYQLRSDNDWTVITGAPTDQNQSYFGDHTFRIERQPVPLGWSFELGRTDSRFENQVPPKATDDTARIALNYAVTYSFMLGVRGGYEKTNLVFDKDHQEQVLYGGEMRWRPSERTNLDWVWEERFFGPSWHFQFDHRMPRVAWNLGLSRDVQSFSETFLTLPPTNNVFGLLDAAFTTRFPDPAERTRVVNSLIADQGLPSSLSGPTSLSTQHVSVVTSRNAQVVVTGVRNSVVVSAYSLRTEDLQDSVFGTSLNVVQDGGSVTVSHQATTLLAINLTGNYRRDRGFGPNEGQKSYQRGVQLQATRQLAPKTTAYAGVRWQNFDSNALGGGVPLPGTELPYQRANEHAAFVGLGHRF
jgi:uncharacterized protein (PEP-CTERM system associated)